MQETGNPRTLRERAAALFRRKNTEDTASGRHRGRKLAAVVVVLAVLAAAFLPRLGAGGGENTVSPLDVMPLSSTDLRRTVSATGTVESAQSVLVYSTQSYAVQEVLVEVGDYVEAGQLMAKLDDGVILDQIESQEAALSASNSASSAAIAAGETDTSGDISFATDVAVTSQDTGLRIGMSVELDFVLDEALNALSVP